MYTLLINNVKSDVFYLILEQYVVMPNRFLLPNVIKCMRFVGRRSRAAYTLTRQSIARH